MSQLMEPRNRETYFTSRNWSGSWFDLAIQLPSHSGVQIAPAVKAAWSNPLMRGPYLSPSRKPPPALEETPPPNGILHWYGEISIDGQWVGCMVIALREADADWVDLSIPNEMLRLHFPAKGWELDPMNNRWLTKVEEALVQVGDGIFRAVPFDLAIIGEETSGFFYADRAGPAGPLSADIVDTAGGFLLSPQLLSKLGLSSPATALPSGLRWIRMKAPLWEVFETRLNRRDPRGS